LEIEDARTGERLTSAGGREPQDFCHSRLPVSRSGRYLLSAGWGVASVGMRVVFDPHAALADPRILDSLVRGTCSGCVGWCRRRSAARASSATTWW